MNNTRKKTALLAILLCFVMLLTSIPAIANTTSLDLKLTDTLKSKLSDVASDEYVDVVIWRNAVNVDEIEKQAFDEIGIKDGEITDDLGIETIQKFIAVKRDLIRNEYEKANSEFSSQMLSSAKGTNILFESKISPVIIATVPKSTLSSTTLAKNESVEKIDLFVNEKVKEESNVANTNIGAANLRDTSSINATGNGVRIGMIESGVPNAYLTYGGSYYFNTSRVFPQSGASTSTHANLVAAIMVGQSITYNGVTYRGIAPNAQLYANVISDTLSFYTAVENLISNSYVNVINMSAGFGTISSYDSLSKWVDHLAFVHDVHFVKSSGNNSSYSSVTSPGLAYNAIVVGSADDNNQLVGSFAPATLSSQVLNSNFPVSSFSNSIFNYSSTVIKPDIVAYGDGIAYGNIFIYGSDATNNSGTSFAAPQVTATIAQLCEKYPSLLTQQVGMKALLATTAVFRPSGVFSIDPNSALRSRFGSGILGSRTAYVTRGASKFWDGSMTTSSKSINISVPSSYSYLRVGLSWIKRNSITGSHTSLPTVNDIPLADLRLELYYNGTLVAVSDTQASNAELIQIPITQYGTYTIKIVNNSYSLGSNYTNQYISVVWY